jgi:hypothetical protein
MLVVRSERHWTWYIVLVRELQQTSTDERTDGDGRRNLSRYHLPLLEKQGPLAECGPPGIHCAQLNYIIRPRQEGHAG